MKQLGRFGRHTAALAAASALLIGAGGLAAWADIVSNNVVVGGNDTIAVGASTTISYYIQTEGNDGHPGCNAADASPAFLTIHAPSAVTVTPNTLEFTACNSGSGARTATFSSSTPGTYTVTVSISDSGPGTYSVSGATFTLKVVSANTPPTLSLPSGLAAEATGPSGAQVSYTATASDTQDGPLTPSCGPASGSTFPLGNTTVNCTVTDSGGLTASGSFTINVQDTTGPEISITVDSTEATSGSGAVVNYTATAIDLVDGDVSGELDCSPASGSTFPLGSTTITCTAEDTRGNNGSGSASVTVQDTTAPVLSLPVDITAEATGPDGAVVTFAATASDIVDGDVTVTCDAESGDTFPLGTTTVDCSATDVAGNSASGSFTITVEDTTAPAIFWSGGPEPGSSHQFGSVPNAPTCTAVDTVSGTVPCTVTGYSPAVGPQTMTANATDQAGNTATASRSFTVLAWTLNGFYRPVDMDKTNTVKGGSTVPLKFNVYAGSTERTSTGDVSSFTARSVSCGTFAEAETDPVEFVTTGGTSLRYDSTEGQFIQNWKTPKGSDCYVVTMTTQDGSKIKANFQTK